LNILPNRKDKFSQKYIPLNLPESATRAIANWRSKSA